MFETLSTFINLGRYNMKLTEQSKILLQTSEARRDALKKIGIYSVYAVPVAMAVLNSTHAAAACASSRPCLN
jgi:maltooligosyltrehalose synthase